jgi:hypothetical protein
MPKRGSYSLADAILLAKSHREPTAPEKRAFYGPTTPPCPCG